MLKAYREHVAERAALGIPPLPLNAKQTAELIELLKNPPKGEEATLLELITHRVPAGVDDAAKVKASYLAAVAHGDEKCALISREKATELLGTMLGGFNVKPLIDLLDDAGRGAGGRRRPEEDPAHVRLFPRRRGQGRQAATPWPRPWCRAGPTPSGSPAVPKWPRASRSPCFKVTGETNTDDLSPAPDAWSRARHPAARAGHAEEQARPGITPEEDGKRGPIKFIEDLRAKGNLVAYVGDVVGTGSSRKSATNWCCGSPAKTFRLCPTSVLAASASAPRSRRSSTTPWKTPAHCRSSST